MNLLPIEEFAQLIIEAQNTNSETSYSTWETLCNFSKENFDTFLTYFITILESSDFPLNTKKILLILFNRLFKFRDDALVITPDIFPSIIQDTLSLFQNNDLELTGLSANLISSLVIPDLSEDGDTEIIVTFAKSFSTVETNSEIYGFSTILYDICYNVQTTRNEQNIIIESIQNQLNTISDKIEIYNLKNFVKILDLLVDSSMEESTIQTILQILSQLIEFIDLHGEIFICFSTIIEEFPSYTETIFQNLVPVAIESLSQNQSNQQSLFYFFDTLITPKTVQYYQEIIPVLLPYLLSILDSEVETFKSDVSGLIENFFCIYEGDIIQLIQSQQNKSNLAFLLASCVMAKTKKGEVNNDFIQAMINSENSRERFMAIRCVKKLTKSDKFNEKLITESVKHCDDEIVEIKVMAIDLVGELTKYEEFPIEEFFTVVLNSYMFGNRDLNDASYSTLTKIIKNSSSDRLCLLVPLILSQFEECLSNNELFEILISLSTLMQSIALQLGEKYSPFAEHSLDLLQKMSTIDEDFLIHSLTPISYIAAKTKFLPFLSDFCSSMIGALQSFCEEYQKKEFDKNDEDFNEVVETMIDAIINSTSYLLITFDIQNFVKDFMNTYFKVFEITHYFKIICGFSDILTKYDELLNEFGHPLFELLSSSSTEIANYIKGDDDDEVIENENEEEEEENDAIDFDLNEVIYVSTDLLNLINIFVDKTSVDESFIEFAFYMIELCQKFLKYDKKELKCSLLSLVSELSLKIPKETMEFIQNHNKIKEAILFGLDDLEIHPISQKIVNVFGPESF